MLARAMTASTGALTMTLGLIFLMHLLIATGEDILIEPREFKFPEWLPPTQPPTEIIESRPPARIVEPPELPPMVPPSTENSTTFSIPTWTTNLPGPGNIEGPLGFGTNDGPLVNIVRVQPTYPPAAIARGLEGHVLVQFDVTAAGTVENVIIVETSNRLFNRFAVEAASRFRYRPQVVDGVPLGATGLRQVFRFTLDDAN